MSQPESFGLELRGSKGRRSIPVVGPKARRRFAKGGCQADSYLSFEAKSSPSGSLGPRGSSALATCAWSEGMCGRNPGYSGFIILKPHIVLFYNYGLQSQNQLPHPHLRIHIASVTPVSPTRYPLIVFWTGCIWCLQNRRTGVRKSVKNRLNCQCCSACPENILQKTILVPKSMRSLLCR